MVLSLNLIFIFVAFRSSLRSPEGKSSPLVSRPRGRQTRVAAALMALRHSPGTFAVAYAPPHQFFARDFSVVCTRRATKAFASATSTGSDSPSPSLQRYQTSGRVSCAERRTPSASDHRLLLSIPPSPHLARAGKPCTRNHRLPSRPSASRYVFFFCSENLHCREYSSEAI